MSPGVSVPALAAVGMAVIAAVAWLLPARGAAARLAAWPRAVLLGLRLIWVGAALALAAGVHWSASRPPRPTVALLEAAGAAGPQAAWASRGELLPLALGPLPPGRAIDGPPPLPGPATLAAALDEVTRTDPPPDAFVAVGPPDPVDLVSAPRPLFVVAPRPSPDRALRLRKLDAPRLAVAGAAFSLNAVFEGGPACASESWEVRLVGPLGTEGQVAVGCPARSFAEVNLTSAVTSPGSWSYRLAWSPAGEPGEERFREFVVEARASTSRALLVELTPGWEATFLRRTLSEAGGMEVAPLARLTRGPALRGLETPAGGAGLGLGAADLGDFDLVIVRGAGDPLETADAEWIRRFVAVRGGGLVLLGRAPGGLEDLAPLRPGNAPPAHGTVVLAAGAGRHPVVRELAPLLAALPPLELEMSSKDPAVGQVLARCGTQPFLAVRRFGAGRVLQVAGPESYRWKLRGGEAAQVHEILWRQAAGWLIGRAGAARQLVADRTSTLPGARVGLEVALRDRSFAPSGAPARLDGDAGGISLLPIPFRPGRFRGVLPAAAGRHRLELAGPPEAPANAPWIVAKAPSAAENAAVDWARVASRVGGHILTLDQPAPEILPAEGISASVRRRSARQTAWLPAVLLLAAALEWGARRRWGCEG